MCDLFHPLITVPPFSSSMNMPPQYAQTAPLPQRPFPSYSNSMHMGFPSYFSSSTHSAAQIQPLFEKPHVTDLVLAKPAFEVTGPSSPIDEGFGNSREDHQASVVNLTLAPLTCSESTIHIIVDESGKSQKFLIHRDLLCFYSAYFRGILADNKVIKAKIRQKNYRREWRWEDERSVDKVMAIGDLAEPEEKMDVDVVIKLPCVVRGLQPNASEKEDGVTETKLSDAVRELRLDTEELGDVPRTVFAAFVNWLYHGYPGFGLFHPLSDHVSFDAVTLIQLWVFAGRIGVLECQNHCIEGIEWWRMTSNIIQTSMLAWIYENTEEYHNEDCGLRSLLIDQCAWKLDGKWLLSDRDGVQNEEQFPREALVDLVSRMRVILNEDVRPPFLYSETRKNSYWIQIEQKTACKMPKL